MKKIKKGDEVIVIAGKDKGRRGKVLRVDGDARRRRERQRREEAPAAERPARSANAKVAASSSREMPLQHRRT